MAAERRRAELEAKRAKLAELKALREQRRATLTSAPPSGRETPSERPASSRAQLDDIINTLLGPSPSSSRQPSERDASGKPGMDLSGRSSRLSGAADDREAANELSDQSIQEPGTSAVEGGYAPVNLLPSFTDASQELFELPPKPKISYDKSVQTASVAIGPDEDAEDDFMDPDRSMRSSRGGPASDNNNVGRESETELRARLLAEFEAERNRLDAEIALAEQEAEAARRKGPEADELSSILASTDFATFLEENSKVVQRALTDKYDYLKDYSLGGLADLGDDLESRKVKCTHTFYDERWTKNRSVSAVDWSSKFPELSLSAYTRNPAPNNDPDGVVAVWNLHLNERPEYIFHAPSDVLSASFSPFHPNLILGGSYSGQILLWDTRARSLPVLKTPLSAAGHTHPVYSLALPGTQNAHNLISASTDGTMCAWVLDMLAKPVETLELTHSGHAKTDEVAVTCLSFPPNETSTFWVGTEEGHIYNANRYDRAGAKAGLAHSEMYRGHAGPVMGLDFHPVNGPIDFGDLFLSCGVDWSVRLWRAKAATASSVPATNGSAAPPSPQRKSSKHGSVVHPIHNFEESEDYVFDVKWHPNHPAMFASVNGAGKFDLWNLAADTEIPIVSTLANPAAPKALNKLAWEKRDGRRAAVGAVDGRTHILDIGDLSVTREADWDATRRTVASLGNR